MASAISSLLSAALFKACESRQSACIAAFDRAGIDGLLVSNEKDIRYLTGFVGHESLAVVARDGTIIVSDSRYDEYLETWRAAGSTAVVMGIRHRLLHAVREICKARSIKRLGIQADFITVTGRVKLTSEVSDVQVVDTDGLVGRLRMRKDAYELALIERAADIQQQALIAALGHLSPGMVEREFSAVLEYEMKMRGASESAFQPIIAAGANSSIMHHSTGETPIREGVLLVDWGANVEGLNADLTRTFGIGSMPAQLREMYSVVLEAQLAAIDAIAPGKICAEIDAVARTVITRAGYGQYFGHGLGHGLGMDVHESPYFNSLQTDVTLEPGVVMTVEPGIYIPGVGGIRIEDNIVVTEDGCRLLSNVGKDLDSAIIGEKPAAMARA
jgi:Xaa-Pro aminopeptidase